MEPVNLNGVLPKTAPSSASHVTSPPMSPTVNCELFVTVSLFSFL